MRGVSCPPALQTRAIGGSQKEGFTVRPVGRPHGGGLAGGTAGSSYSVSSNNLSISSRIKKKQVKISCSVMFNLSFFFLLAILSITSLIWYKMMVPVLETVQKV